MEDKNLIVVTTAVKCLTVATCFTPEMRFLQIMRTILSIHEKIPNPFIVILDTGTLTNEQTTLLEQYVNQIINMHSSMLSKNAGEIVMLYKYFSSPQFQEVLPSIKTFSKISGRYFLTERFNFEKHDLSKNLIKLTYHHVPGNYIEGRYFRIPKERLIVFCQKYVAMVDDLIEKKTINTVSIEVELFKYSLFDLEYSIYKEHLGVGGNFACTGKYNED
jgi:hypothetical protein